MSSTVSSPTPSNGPPFVLVGNPGCPRVAFFQAALARCGLPPAKLISYADLIAGEPPSDSKDSYFETSQRSEPGNRPGKGSAGVLLL